MSINATPDWIGKANTLKLRVRDLIAGRWCEPAGEPLEKHSPRDGRLLYQFGCGIGPHTDQAVESARRAFADGRWSQCSPQHRKQALLELCSLMEQHFEELALLESLDVGKPITEALTTDVPMAIEAVRFHAEICDKLQSPVYGADRTSLSYQLRRPIGVVAGVVGWNFPLALATSKIGPILAAGNSLVLKPSELTSLSAARVAELAMEAGVPEGVLNIVHGGPAVGAALAHHPDVDLLTFTGSTATGKKMLIAAGQSNMKRLVLECGGKAANVVFDDCPNLEGVAAAVVMRTFWNQGQVCTASSRLLVQDNIKEKLLPLIIARAKTLTPADPLLPETRFAALVSRQHQQKVSGYVASGERDGARTAYRSKAPAPFAQGFYMPPVIFDEVKPAHRIAREEIFGPVLSVMTFRDEDEAVRIANSTIYGLSAILWTQNLARAHRLTQKLQVGWTVVNATDKPSAGATNVAIGGHKQSGLGVEGGTEGLEEYLTKTAIQVFV